MRSILEQTDEQFEFLLVDGDSHDNTVKVVKNLLEEYGFPNSRFILIQEKDKGVYDAMNKGVVLAMSRVMSPSSGRRSKTASQK